MVSMVVAFSALEDKAANSMNRISEQEPMSRYLALKQWQKLCIGHIKAIMPILLREYDPYKAIVPCIAISTDEVATENASRKRRSLIVVNERKGQMSSM